MVKKEKGKLYDDETESILAQYYVKTLPQKVITRSKSCGIIPLDPLHEQR